jgi:mRNA interferase MazF
VVISHEVFNRNSGTVIAFAITSREPRVGFPLVHELTTAELPKRSWVKMGQIRTLSVQRLGNRIGRVAEDEVDHLVDGLRQIVG